MKFKRRDFLRLAGNMGAAAVYSEFRGELSRLFEWAADDNVRAIWLHGASDKGCTISLLQGVGPDLADVIMNFRLATDFDPTLMSTPGDSALFSLTNALTGRTPLDLLVVEGAVPAGNLLTAGETSGKPVPIEAWVRDLGLVARQVVAVGTCAAFGNVSASAPESAHCRPVSSLVTRSPLINIPGCPAHPDWVFLTLATILSGSMPALDARLRPRFFFHEHGREGCPLGEYLERHPSQAAPGLPVCLYDLGCGGKTTDAECPTRHWTDRARPFLPGLPQNGRQFYSAGAPCNGCAEPGFPETPFSPF